MSRVQFPYLDGGRHARVRSIVEEKHLSLSIDCLCWVYSRCYTCSPSLPKGFDYRMIDLIKKSYKELEYDNKIIYGVITLLCTEYEYKEVNLQVTAFCTFHPLELVLARRIFFYQQWKPLMTYIHHKSLLGKREVHPYVALWKLSQKKFRHFSRMNKFISYKISFFS